MRPAVVVDLGTMPPFAVLPNDPDWLTSMQQFVRTLQHNSPTDVPLRDEDPMDLPVSEGDDLYEHADTDVPELGDASTVPAPPDEVLTGSPAAWSTSLQMRSVRCGQ